MRKRAAATSLFVRPSATSAAIRARPPSARRARAHGRRSGPARPGSAPPRAAPRAARSVRARPRGWRGRRRASSPAAECGPGRAASAPGGTGRCCAHARRAPARSSRRRRRGRRAQRGRARGSGRGSRAPRLGRGGRRAPATSRGSRLPRRARPRRSSASSRSPSSSRMPGSSTSVGAGLVGAAEVDERRVRVSERELDEAEHPAVARLGDPHSLCDGDGRLRSALSSRASSIRPWWAAMTAAGTRSAGTCRRAAPGGPTTSSRSVGVVPVPCTPLEKAQKPQRLCLVTRIVPRAVATLRASLEERSCTVDVARPPELVAEDERRALAERPLGQRSLERERLFHLRARDAPRRR